MSGASENPRTSSSHKKAPKKYPFALAENLSVDIDTSGKSITVTGTVHTFIAKELAQELIKALSEDCLPRLPGYRMVGMESTSQTQSIDQTQRIGIEEIFSYLSRIRENIATYVAEVFAAGADKDVEFRTLIERQKFAKKMQEILDFANLEVECPTCRQGARLKAVASVKSENGIYQYDHTRGKRSTHQGGDSLHPLLLAPAKPDGRTAAKQR